jgi:hypothetical protein
VAFDFKQHVPGLDAGGLGGGLGEDRGDAGAAGSGKEAPARARRRGRKGRGALDDDSDASGRPRRGVSQLLVWVFWKEKDRKVVRR